MDSLTEVSTTVTDDQYLENESQIFRNIVKICNSGLNYTQIDNFDYELCKKISLDYNNDNELASLIVPISIIVPILFGIIVIVGLIGNALVVIVVACNPQMRSTTNLLIINLAIADLLFIVLCVPFTAWDYAFPFWAFGNVWCKIVQYLIVVFAYDSIYTLVLMSLDRFLAVVYPIESISIRTERNAYLAIFLTWITIILGCIPVLFAYKELKFDNSDVICHFSIEEYNHSLYQICFFLSSYVIPICVILILYVLMLKRLWFGVVPGGHMSAESVRSKKRVTRMVVVVVIIFACCWCPIQVVLVLRSFGKYKITANTLIIQIAANILAYMNSCVNPILYAFLSENFRKAFHKLIVCYCYDRRAQQTRNDRLDRELTVGTTVTKSAKLVNGNV